MGLPRDFLDEVETELREARRELVQNRERTEALEELRRVALAVSAERDRPITVFDVIRSTCDSIERKRRASLVRQLRVRKHQTHGPTRPADAR
jgi:translation initiation factor RLI1